MRGILSIGLLVMLLLVSFWNPIQGLHYLNTEQQEIFTKAINTEPCYLNMWRITPYWNGLTNGRALGTYGFIYNAGGWTNDELWCITRHECKEEQKGGIHDWNYLWNECWEEGWYQ